MSMMHRKLPLNRIHLLVPTKLPGAGDPITIFLELKEVRGGLACMDNLVRRPGSVIENNIINTWALLRNLLHFGVREGVT
jgi:hypothetical protein